jgi:hypothetical protein
VNGDHDALVARAVEGILVDVRRQAPNDASSSTTREGMRGAIE